MHSWIDGALYPDTETPQALDTLAEQVDFMARLCAAWDFGVLPWAETVIDAVCSPEAMETLPGRAPWPVLNWQLPLLQYAPG